MYSRGENEERTCDICGKVFHPTNWNQRLCTDPKCKEEGKRMRMKKWRVENPDKYFAYQERKAIRDRKKKQEQTKRVPKPDTIVAIGYAERQMAASLAMAGKVRTEL